MVKYFVKKYKNSFFDVVHKNIFYFVSHVEASKVVDRFVRDLATPQQFGILKKVFSSKLENPDMNQEQSIENLAVKIIEKGNHYPLLSKHVLTLALPIMIPGKKKLKKI
jgi:pumilio homology domain family member 6